jgi:hypothetical protein
VTGSNPMPKPIFKRSAVAFLDILGFREFIKKVEISGSKEAQEFAKLQDVIDAQLRFTSNDDQQIHLFPKEVELKIIHISDSFILSAPIHNKKRPGYSGITAVLIKTIQLSHQLLKMGFLLRGGIAVGNVYRTGRNIFGTGYQNAYETETTAKFPRILFHASAVEFLNNETHPGYPVSRHSIFVEEGDQLLLDTLNTHWSYLGQDVEDGSRLPEIFGSYRSMIENNLKELPPGDPREKWAWMARFFNAKLRDTNDLRSITPINIESFSKFRFGQAVEEPPVTSPAAWMRQFAASTRYVTAFNIPDHLKDET